MSLIPSLFVLLIAAYALGGVCSLLKQPPIAGYLIAGILLGPSVLSFIQPNEQLGAVSHFSVLIVVLTAGLEMRFQDVVVNLVGRAAIASLIGFLLPAAAGAVAAAAFGLSTVPMLVVAMCLAVTALPVALQILNQFSMLNTRIATVSIGGALLSDILVFAAIGVLSEVALPNSTQSLIVSLLGALARMAGLILAVAIAHWICVNVLRRLGNRDDTVDEAAVNISLSLLFVLALASVGELFGFHFAIGAFFAAMMLTPEVIGARSFEKLSETCRMLTVAAFGPLFLTYQGIQFQAQTLPTAAFLIALIVVAVLSKLVAGYLVGRMQKLSSQESWGVGIVSNARGVMGLIVASIAFHARLIDAGIFSALLLVGLATTALTPLMLQRWRASTSGVRRESETGR